MVRTGWGSGAPVSPEPLEPGEAEGGDGGALGRMRSSSMATFSTCTIQILVLSPALPHYHPSPHLLPLPNHSNLPALRSWLSCPVTHFPQPGMKPPEARLSLDPSRIRPRCQNGASELWGWKPPYAMCTSLRRDVGAGVTGPNPEEKSARAWGHPCNPPLSLAKAIPPSEGKTDHSSLPQPRFCLKGE